MLTQNHAVTANEFLDASDKEFAAGDHLQASEKLWGAATHAVMAVAQQREWPHRSHRSLKNAVGRLTAETGDDGSPAGFWPPKSSTRTSTTTKWKTLRSNTTGRWCTGSSPES